MTQLYDIKEEDATFELIPAIYSETSGSSRKKNEFPNSGKAETVLDATVVGSVVTSSIAVHPIQFTTFSPDRW